MKAIDLSGERFGSLVATKRAENKGRNTYWICVCDCGRTISVSTTHLRRGKTKSCGCQTSKLKSINHQTHGLTETHLYNIWIGMKQRCFSENHSSYSDYGGRGITICEEWKDDFTAFYDWSLRNGWNEGLEIDRMDNNGSYSPENCRWVSRTVQNNNKRNNHYIEYNGKTQTMAQWAKELNMNPVTLKSRIRRGWSIEDAFTKPISNDGKRV